MIYYYYYYYYYYYSILGHHYSSFLVPSPSFHSRLAHSHYAYLPTSIISFNSCSPFHSPPSPIPSFLSSCCFSFFSLFPILYIRSPPPSLHFSLPFIYNYFPTSLPFMFYFLKPTIPPLPPFHSFPLVLPLLPWAINYYFNAALHKLQPRNV